MSVQLPDKLYFKIGEVAELTGVKPHVLRYWESEFGSFRPGKSRNQQRLYRQRDVELVLRLKDLLYNQGFTIAGARKKLRERSVEPALSSDRFRWKIQADRPPRRNPRDLRRLRQSLETLP